MSDPGLPDLPGPDELPPGGDPGSVPEQPEPPGELPEPDQPPATAPRPGVDD